MRTAEFISTITYGTVDEANAALRRVRGLHAPVPGGTDPELLAWIHCCEVDSFLTTVRRGGLSLTADEADRYVAEQVLAATLMGVPSDLVPDSQRGLAEYFRRVRPVLALTPQAMEAVRFLFFPPMPGILAWSPARPAWSALVALAFGLLPRWARRMYHAPAIPTTDVAATVAVRTLRAAAMLVPPELRVGPRARTALRSNAA